MRQAHDDGTALYLDCIHISTLVEIFYYSFARW